MECMEWSVQRIYGYMDIWGEWSTLGMLDCVDCVEWMEWLGVGECGCG